MHLVSVLYSKKFVCKKEMRETHKTRDNVCDLDETVEQIFAFYKLYMVVML